MIRRLFIILSLVIAIMFHVNAQQTDAWSSLDSNAIMIGDQVEYKIGITIPQKAIVKWPLILDTITSNIEVIDRNAIDTILENDVMSLSQTILVTSFDSGYFEIPIVNFGIVFENDTTIYSTSTGALFLQVYVPEVDTAQAFKPIISPFSEPYTLKEILPWVIGFLAVIIVVSLLVYYISKRRKNKPIFSSKVTPKLPPHVIALNELEELRLEKIWQSGKIKKYYTVLTNITREYLTNRYQLDALEMTSHEILNYLENKKINKNAMTKLSGVLYMADMVKFAKANPTALENDLGISHCVDFVNETKEVIITGNHQLKEEASKDD
ncbi:MAG: hypothetical protein P8N48_05525 [Bacteroidales bacterium]|nr:hypothetical protein [Bacteroidales bacterium]MDG1901893.1 hypothetical protein [Bacteroidales bacterium]MDG2081038.1 hypothetical protein [Bacteroidales bacterium]|tara:strand:- start:793 stop:1764 length:972 start_codon:yes stop_codon:yes gene_type:complete